MRRRFRWLLAVIPCLLAGCAQQEKTAVHADPTQEELLLIERREPIIQATVMREGATTQPAIVLVPELEEPPLTPAEKAALGEDEPEYEFLPYNLPWIRPGSHVGPWLGGASAGITPGGAASSGVGPKRTISGSNEAFRGAETGVDPASTRISRMAPASQPTAGVWPEQGATTGTDPLPRKVGQAKRSRER